MTSRVLVFIPSLLLVLWKRESVQLSDGIELSLLYL
jgi:hypothetical protein